MQRPRASSPMRSACWPIEGARQSAGRRPVARARCSTCGSRSPTCSSTSRAIAELKRVEELTDDIAARRLRHARRHRGRPRPRRHQRRHARCRRRHRLSRGAQPRHDRRQPVPCRSRRRLGLGAGGARRGGRRAQAPAGRATLPVEDFVTGALRDRARRRRAARRPSACRAVSAAARWGYYKVCRKTGEFAAGDRRRAARSRAQRVPRRDRRHRRKPLVLSRRARAVRRLDRPRANSMPARPTRCCRRAGMQRRARPPASTSSRCARAVDRRPPHEHRSRSPSTASRFRGSVEPRTHLADFLREQPRPHRHASRLRARRLRRLHRPDRRRAGALLHHLCGGLRRRRGRTIEGFDDDAMTPRLREAFTARARAAMRLLHAGHAGHRARPRAARCRTPTSTTSASR